MVSTITLSSAHRVQIEAEARAAFPKECCGLLEGVRDGNVVRVIAVHPACNLSEDADRFEIDPAIQFALMRALRDTEREILGCYHSHPNGKAEPSPRDREGAGEEGFVWLIAGVAADVTLRAFAYCGGEFIPLVLSERRAASGRSPG